MQVVFLVCWNLFLMGDDLQKELPLSTLVPAIVREEFDLEAKRRRIKLKEAVTQAMRLWLGTAIPSNAGIQSPQSSEIRNGDTPEAPSSDKLDSALVKRIAEATAAKVLGLLQGDELGEPDHDLTAAAELLDRHRRDNTKAEQQHFGGTAFARTADRQEEQLASFAAGMPADRRRYLAAIAWKIRDLKDLNPLTPGDRDNTLKKQLAQVEKDYGKWEEAAKETARKQRSQHHGGKTGTHNID